MGFLQFFLLEKIERIVPKKKQKEFLYLLNFS